MAVIGEGNAGSKGSSADFNSSWQRGCVGYRRQVWTIKGHGWKQWRKMPMGRAPYEVIRCYGFDGGIISYSYDRGKQQQWWLRLHGLKAADEGRKVGDRSREQ
ncbi:hypothetical protein B296_00012460 [Ensete ventricosum]|uniref:Uncharacterized protein n=1 Tax=Ensete ventricosum TaxID=4639 RepID=A0A427B6H9_ENSVE|nr:hypothetical protein B296_00012460 [Ensete ventricosum]